MPWVIVRWSALGTDTWILNRSNIFCNLIKEDYTKAAQRWLDRGAQVIGGCCGVRKEHICALQEVV